MPNDPTKNSSSSIRRWTPEEDIALTRAYLCVTVDAIVGKDQNSQTMWARIMKCWRENLGTYDPARGANGLACRWSAIQAAVNKFYGLYESIERAPKSGTTIIDVKREALRMYTELDGSIFKFGHCWEIMKENPKWCSEQLTKVGCSKRAKTLDESSNQNVPQGTPTPLDEFDYIGVDNPATENINIDGNARPLGRKGSKEKKRKMAERKGVADALSNLQITMEKQYTFNQQNMELRQETIKRALELKERAQQLKEEAQRKRDLLEKRKEEERILNADLDTFQPLLRSVYEKRQAQILKEWEEAGIFGDMSTNDEAACQMIIEVI